MEMNAEMEEIMMNFAERNGFSEIRSIQVNEIDMGLRNRLLNAVHKYWEPSPRIHNELGYVVDRVGICDERTERANWRTIDSLMLRKTEDIPWYMPYEIIELIFEAKRFECGCCENYHLCKSLKAANKGFCDEFYWFAAMPDRLNKILEEEKSGYRLNNEKFVKITNEVELDSLHQASNAPYHSVNTHIRKAISLYSDRKNPDYENSIKESISAVEAICCTITGMTGSSATLGAAIKRLEDSGIVIHAALRDAFSKMYGYTSDSDGIRHGGIDFKNAPAEDAKYMLVSCSAFVNYLIEKHGKIGGTNE